MYIINKVDIKDGMATVNIDITIPEAEFNDTIANAKLGVLQGIADELTQ